MSSSGKKHPFYMVSPPPMFTYLDNRLSCCFGPLSKANISFFRTVSIEKLYNFSGKKLDSALGEYCTSVNLNIQDININDQDFPRTSIPKFNEWLTLQVVEIVNNSTDQSIVIYGSLDNHISSLIIACLRRQYDWSLISIFSEFRQFTWPYKLRDFEQLIENYRPVVIDVLVPTDATTTAKKIDLEEEESRNENEPSLNMPLEGSSLNLNGPELVHEINDVLRQLFLSSPHTKLISSHCSFDPTISLVNDKEDDD